MEKELEISGKNIEEAIALGLKELNCSKDDVEIKILDEGTKGLFGLMGTKPAKVLLTLKDTAAVSSDGAEAKTENAENNTSAKQSKRAENISNADFGLACKNVQEYVSKIVSLMKININEIKVSHNNEVVNVEVYSDSGSLLIGKGGQSLNALEYIVQLMINNNPNTRVKVNIDTENYRQKQQERLKALADKAIEYVRRTKKIYRFDPMSAKERKFIHTYFESFNEFDTFSEGEGSLRKVGVKLSGQKDNL